MKSVAIIGAGASGLTAIKCCLEDGLQPTCFERTATLGGLWYYTDEVRPGQACTAKTTTANTSKEMLAFSDYPMPDEFPNYLHNTKVLEYLFMYAKHFDLEKHIHFQTDVVSLKPASDYDSTGRWVVETRSVETGLLASATFDAVLVGNGHHSVPNRPTIAGEDVFRGRVIHSFEYRDHRGYEDQTVVVVGLGNSGGDIAVDLSRIAKQVYLSTRSGAWVVDRIANHGFPIDLFALRRVVFAIRKFCPRRFFNWILASNFNAKFDHVSYSLRPTSPYATEYPIVNDELPNRVICGAVVIKADVSRLTATGVQFDDGTAASDVHVVILATGYRMRFPFLEDSGLSAADNLDDLYHHVFPPDARHPTLAVIGTTRPAGPAFAISEMQCRWVNRVLKGECTLPSAKQMWKFISDYKRELQSVRPDTTQVALEVGYVPYMTELASYVGCRPNIGMLWLRDPALAWSCYFGPCTPYQFRLRGPGQWPGAREAIVTSWQRVLRPLQTRPLGAVGGRSPSILRRALNVAIVAIVVAVVVQCYYL